MAKPHRGSAPRRAPRGPDKGQRPLDPVERRAAQQRDIDRQLRTWPPRRILAWALFGVAVVVAAQHMTAHLGWRPVPLSMGWQDVLIGYPAAAVLAIIGAFSLPRRSGQP